MFIWVAGQATKSRKSKNGKESGWAKQETGNSNSIINSIIIGRKINGKEKRVIGNDQ